MRKRLLTWAVALAILLPFGNTLQAQLSGGYTIDAGSAATATNYLSFAAAVQDMMVGTRPDGGPANGAGVSGPVVFTVAAGTYNETISIGTIAGVSATNTVTFDGVNPATRKITYNSTNVGGFTIQVNGPDYIRFHNLEIENTGTSYGYCVQFVGLANHCEVKGCKLTMPTTSTNSYKVGVSATTAFSTYGNFAEYLNIENNEIVGGYAGINLNGQSTGYSNGHTIVNNDISESYYTGISMSYIDSAVVMGNTVTNRNVYTSSYGMRIRYCSSFGIISNNLQRMGTYGIYLYYSNYNVAHTRGIVANNMIGGDFISTATSYGVYFYGNVDVDFWHNSILVNNPGTGSRGIYISGSTSSGNNIVNNSFASTASGGTTYAMYCTSTNYVASVDYNNYYTSGGYFVYFGGTYANLSALQTGQPAFNANSQEGWPNYISNTDLHVFGTQLSNWANNSTSIMVDIDGDLRPLAPDVVKDVGADEYNLAPFDLDLMSIVSPLVLTLGNNTVSFEAQNNGLNSLNGISFTAQYSTDGGTTWPVTQVFTPATLGSPGNTEIFTFTTPWNVASAGTYTLCVRISVPIPGDPDTGEQICNTTCTGMNGAYTVNSALPTGGTNFNSFTDMATALNGCGISGPVTITAAAGTYNEFFELNDIIGTSSTNTVTIDGVAAAQCTLSYNFTSTNTAMVRLNGSDYIRIKNMTILPTGTYGYGFHLTNQADHNEISNCEIEYNTTTTTAYRIGALISGSSYSTSGNNGNYNLFKNLHIQGGYYGVRMNGSSSTVHCTQNRVEDCTIENYYYYGIYSIYQNAPRFTGNTIHAQNGYSSTNAYGIYCSYADSSFAFENNTIHTVGARCIYLANANVSQNGTGRIVNNMLGANFMGSTIYALYMTGVRNTDVFHNSINLSYSNGYACYITSSTSTGINLKNNIFAAPGYSFSSGQPLYVSTTGILSSSDYNQYYTTGPTLVYLGGFSFSDLASYQTTFPGNDQNSVEAYPGFISQTNLHIICSAADNLGTPLASVPQDIDAQNRSTTAPDIGADEYTAQTISLNLGPDLSNCGVYEISVDTNYTIYDWTNVNSNQPTATIDTTGMYALQVTDSNNCQASDTVNITILELPSPYYGTDTLSQCSYDTITAGNIGSSYNWSTGDTTRTILPTAQGTYTVTVTSTDGCVNFDTVTIGFFANVALNLGPDTSFCLGGSHTIDAGSQPTGTQYQWSNGANTQVVIVSAPAVYGVTVTSPDGCVAEDSVEVTSLLPPLVNLGPDRVECDQFTLDAGAGGAAYNWSTGANTQTITATAGGSYIVTVTNAVGCQSMDTVVITLGGTPLVNLGPDQVVCNGASITLDAGNTGSTYNWSTGASTQTISVNQPGTYIVEVTNGQGCTGMDTITVTQSAFTVNIGPDGTICPGESIQLDAGSNGSSYSWSTGAGTQTITVTTAGTYTVTVTDPGGCVATDDITFAAGQAITADFTSPTNVPLWQNIQFTDNSNPTPTGWSWDFGDGGTSSQQNPTYNYVAMGTFTVCLTSTNGTCDDTFCQDVTVGPPVGVEDPDFADQIVLYPNPNDGRFNLRFNLSETTDLFVEIFAVDGKRCYTRMLENVRDYEEQVDISGSASGIYFLRVTSRSGLRSTRRIMID